MSGVGAVPAELAGGVRAWIDGDPDPTARAELQALLDAGATADLAERFAGSLTFGTAGLRGPLRAGPAGMNRAVVRRAAAGVAAYLDLLGAPGPVVIGYDARHGSADFARDSAAVIAGAGRRALLLPTETPTPVLAYAVRHLAAAAGVMVTASHNPPQDNGYKVYLGDGAQIVPPADAGIQVAIATAGPAATLPTSAYTVLGPEVLDAYVAAVVAGCPPGPRALRVAYTALHGVGAPVLRRVFAAAGFTAPVSVTEQEEPDPDFPTVAFPNPEEPGVMDRVVELGTAAGADLAIANDPDADRCAVACGGRVLTGDEVGVLLADALLTAGIRGTFATTIVSSSMLRSMCAAAGAPYAETLTGFKWIVRGGEQTGVPLAFGYEEALGYAVAPDVVRDKDGISAALLLAARAAALAASGATLLDRLDDLAREHGVHATGQLSVRVGDLAELAVMMERLRLSPPAALAGRPVTVEDLAPAADVVRLRAPGVRVVVRPSGTEPKLKAYLEAVLTVQGSLRTARATAAATLSVLRAEIATALGV